MSIELYLLPARDGDCLLLRHSTGVSILIDTGYHKTYLEYLKPRLMAWAAEGKVIDYCIITHIDADHIEGAIQGLFPDNQVADAPRVIPIRQVWHNSYRHLKLTGTAPMPISSADEAILKSFLGRQIPRRTSATGPRLLNARQGTSLSAQLVKYRYAWNTATGSGPLVVPLAVELAPGLTCRLVSPTTAGLTKLASRWETELTKWGVQVKLRSGTLMEEAYEFWQQVERLPPAPARPVTSTMSKLPTDYLSATFVEDKSATNGSSLAFVLETATERLLLLGDAHPSVVLSELTRLYAVEATPWWFDAIKLSHHGSFANNSPALLQAVDSDIYLISTDGGRHHHPDLATIAWVVTRPVSRLGQVRTLYCNYFTPSIAQFDRADWQEIYHYAIVVVAPETPISISAC